MKLTLLKIKTLVLIFDFMIEYLAGLPIANLPYGFQKVLRLIFGPAAFTTLALEHANREAASWVHHLVSQPGLCAALAAGFFPGLRPAQSIATVEVHSQSTLPKVSQ
jgi:hypothetical protein